MLSNCTAFYNPRHYSDLSLGPTPLVKLSLERSDPVLNFPVASDLREPSLLLLKRRNEVLPTTPASLKPKATLRGGHFTHHYHSWGSHVAWQTWVSPTGQASEKGILCLGPLETKCHISQTSEDS